MLNRICLMGRLTKDPETRYSNAAEPVAVTRYTIACDRSFKKPGEQDCDFIDCVTFRNNADFAQKYFKKGLLVAVSGRLQIRRWEDQQGQSRWSTEVVVDEQNFAESKASFESRGQGGGAPQGGERQGGEKPREKTATKPPPQDSAFFMDDNLDDDEDLPF